jgi:hypothetical protein
VHGHQQLSLFNAHYTRTNGASCRSMSTTRTPAVAWSPFCARGRYQMARRWVRICVVWCCAFGSTGRTHASPSVATAITGGVKRWIGASRTGSTISSVCPLTRSWPLRSSERPMTCASDARPPIWMWCATTPRPAMAPNPGRAPAASWHGSRRRGRASIPAMSSPTSSTVQPSGSVTACARGRAWNLIERHESQLASDRISCRSPLANQMRLILHTAACWLILTVRDAIPCMQPLASGEFSTIRLRLLKVAVRINEAASRIDLAFAANCPDAALFRGLIGALVPRPT